MSGGERDLAPGADVSLIDSFTCGAFPSAASSVVGLVSEVAL